MPELPEVETVKNTLIKKLLNKKIKYIEIKYDGIIKTDKLDFVNNIKNKTIKDINRLGKWLIFNLDDYFLVSHLCMEGKYFIKDISSPILKHEHIIFYFDDFTLRYHDTRKFGSMYLVKKDRLYLDTPLSKIGLEPFDSKLDVLYLENKLKKNKPIKSLLLEQDIIAGIGNIYADEILFLSKINPLVKGKDLNNKNLQDIIDNTRLILSEAINLGGTTIRSYTSSLGVIGHYQDKLYVHCREGRKCKICKNTIVKMTVLGRGTYFCPNCQKGD